MVANPNKIVNRTAQILKKTRARLNRTTCAKSSPNGRQTEIVNLSNPTNQNQRLYAQTALAKQRRIVDPSNGKYILFPYSCAEVSGARTRMPQFVETPNKNPKQNCRRIATSIGLTVSLVVTMARVVKSARRNIVLVASRSRTESAWKQFARKPEPHCK